MNKGEDLLFCLLKQYEKMLHVMNQITSYLEEQYQMAKNIILKNNLKTQTLNVSSCELNQDLIRNIQELAEDLKAKVQFGDRNIFIQTNNHIKALSINMQEKIQKDPYKYNSDITLYKPQLRQSFLERVGQSCNNIYTIRLESFQSENDTEIQDIDIEKLTIFNKISVLSLKNSMITDKSIQFLKQQLPNIRDIDISGCYLLTEQSLKLLTEYELICIRINNMDSFSQQKINELISLSPSLNYLEMTSNSNFNQNYYKSLFEAYTERRNQLKWIQVTTDSGVDIFVNQLSYLTSSHHIDEILDEEVSILLTGKQHIKGLFFDNCQNLTKKSLQFIVKNCPNLQKLSLSKFIQLNDGLVQTLSLQLHSLKYLDLNCCYNITNNSLYHLSTNLPDLESISFEKCKSIHDEGITYLIKKVSKLSHLNLSHCNKLTDETPLYLCKNLTYLNLSYCDQLTDESMEVVSENLLKLKHLNLNYCENLTDSSISLLASRLKKLQALQIEWCQVSQKCIRYIAQNLTDLKVLNINFCPYVCDEEMKIVAKRLRKLEVLKLQSCDKISSEGFQLLSLNLEHLKVLCLKQCIEANDLFIKSITGKSSNLKYLDLSWCRKITDRSLFSISKNLYNLSYLNLSGCIQITNEGIQWISASISKIQYLNITLCDNIDDKGVMAITQSMKFLKILFLCQLSQVTDLSISTISNLVELQQLHLLGLRNITSYSLICLHNLQKIVYLNISQCLSIEGSSLNHLCQFMGKIKFLQISEIQINDKFLEMLAESCRNLQFINLCYCKNISDESVLRLLEHLPRLIRIQMQNTNLSNRTKQEVFHALTNRKMEKVVLQ